MRSPATLGLKAGYCTCSRATKTLSCAFFMVPLIICSHCGTDVNRKCWCVTTKGMHAVGQVEVVVLLQCLPEEKSFPKDIFSHFVQLYRDTLTGQSHKHTRDDTHMQYYYIFFQSK